MLTLNEFLYILSSQINRSHQQSYFLAADDIIERMQNLSKIFSETKADVLSSNCSIGLKHSLIEFEACVFNWAIIKLIGLIIVARTSSEKIFQLDDISSACGEVVVKIKYDENSLIRRNMLEYGQFKKIVDSIISKHFSTPTNYQLGFCSLFNEKYEDYDSKIFTAMLRIEIQWELLIESIFDSISTPEPLSIQEIEDIVMNKVISMIDNLLIDERSAYAMVACVSKWERALL